LARFFDQLGRNVHTYADFYEAYRPNAVSKAKEYLSKNYKNNVSNIPKEKDWTMGIVH
jgi:hypothetical protein